MGEIKQATYWGLANNKYHLAKFSCPCDLAPKICASLCIYRVFQKQSVILQ